MAPKKVDQGAIIILDIGRNVSTPGEKNEKSFFEQARECAIRLIEREILKIKEKDLVGIILLGSKTKNAMAEQVPGAFRHIEMYSELVSPTWSMIRKLPDTPSQTKGDWVDAIIVAADHFKNLGRVNIQNKKIVLITNFKVPTANDPKDIKLVLDGLQKDKYKVDVIGPDIHEDMANGDIRLAQQFVETTDGDTATFECISEYPHFHKLQGAISAPWHVDLSIGPNIKIPVSAYIRLEKIKMKRWIKSGKEYEDMCFDNADNEKLKDNVPTRDENKKQKKDTVIKGYLYGQEIIPFTNNDEKLLYKGGPKCLSIYGFTDASNITWQNLSGDGLHYLFGRKDDKKAQATIKCLVECLHEMNLVGIARKVYNDNNAPKMLALFPVIDTNNYICLSMVPLCFREDIKHMAFPDTNLNKFNCTDAQVKGFVDLIKAMDLTRAYDESSGNMEAFPVGETVSPFAQHMLECIAFRAIHPNEPLPQPRDDIMNLFKMPPLIEKRSREPMEKLKSLFELNKVEKKVKKQNVMCTSESFEAYLDMGASDESEVVKIELPEKPMNEIKRIGTFNPIGDYTALKANEKPMANLAEEMTAALESMIKGNLDGNYTKAFDAMLFFRKECVNSNPSYYNNWLKTFKEMLNYRNKHDIIGMISEKNADFILKSENNLSDYVTTDGHNESQLYKNDTVPDSIELTLQTEDHIMFADF